MRKVNIFDHNTGEYIAKELDFYGITDALVNEFCDDSTPQEVYDACVELGDAYAKMEPCDGPESYLGVEITTC